MRWKSSGKDISKVRVVFNGAGAAGIACAEHYVRLGVKRENIILCDTKGVVYKGRTEGMNTYKERFAQETELRTLAEAHGGRGCFCRTFGERRGHAGDGPLAWLRDPIVFAMANPDPEITYEEAKAAAPTSSSPPGAPIIPTRSTTCWDSPSSSAARSTCAPPPSTKK